MIVILHISCVLLTWSAVSQAFDFKKGLKQFALAADVLGEIINVVDDCEFTCPKGLKRVPNTSYISKPNGCGAYGFTVNFSRFPALTHCCNDHDSCYDTCGAEKAVCEEEFKTCLRSACSLVQSFKDNKEHRRACTDVVKVMSGGTSLFGCAAFLESQQNACSCLKDVRKYDEL